MSKVIIIGSGDVGSEAAKAIEQLTAMGHVVVFEEDDNRVGVFGRPSIPITTIPDEMRNYHPILIEDSGKPFYHSAPNKGNRKNQRKKR